MKKYNYFYDGQPIPKDRFLQVVPENWESEVICGTYSWGYYHATEILETDE